MIANLTDLNILALDCQTTGAHPDKGHLLEIGWISSNASSPVKPQMPAVQAYLLRLPPDTAIPRAVQHLTGISDESRKSAVPAEIVWQHLIETVQKVNRANRSTVCPTVIHFARFEAPFLRELYHQHGSQRPFPFQIICTHEIAVRLLPNLPRRGIRALAGYFGHHMPEFKRSGDHAAATAFIWQKMIALLDATCGIARLDQLLDWLAATRPAGRSTRTFPMNPDNRRRLPPKPGVYRMLNANGDLLYIGKAKSLKHRVDSYFRPKAAQPEHTLEMLTQARKLDVTLTGSALEAAVLESDEIKRHAPPYNIALRQRRRNIVFCSKDLRQHSNAAHRGFVIGPLPNGKSIDAISAFATWLSDEMQLADDDPAGIGCTLLALPPQYAPEFPCLREGVEMFKDKHRRRLERQSPLRILTALGAQIWREHLKIQALAATIPEYNSDNGELAAQNEPAGDEPAWTPEAVAAAIEKMIMHGAHLIRRARWFCLLSESALTWEPADNPRGYKTLMVFENGAVRQRDAVEVAKEPPVPPGFAKSFATRRKSFDLITYDRLRVLTTELRRLISQGRPIELRLGPRVTLGRDELTKALRWV